MQAFLDICEYFQITPLEFFDTEDTNPVLIKSITDESKKLPDEDLILFWK